MNPQNRGLARLMTGLAWLTNTNTASPILIASPRADKKWMIIASGSLWNVEVKVVVSDADLDDAAY